MTCRARPFPFSPRATASARAGFVLVWCWTSAVPGFAASLLPGEALCGAECATLSSPPELGTPEAAPEQPIWPLRFIDDDGRAYLGDFVPEGPPLRDLDAPSTDGDVPGPERGTDPLLPR